MKKILMLSMLVASLGLLSGCNTVNGFGHDVSNTGHAISDAT